MTDREVLTGLMSAVLAIGEHSLELAHVQYRIEPAEMPFVAMVWQCMIRISERP